VVVAPLAEFTGDVVILELVSTATSEGRAAKPGSDSSISATSQAPWP
jgi:hypothetical protein